VTRRKRIIHAACDSIIFWSFTKKIVLARQALHYDILIFRVGNLNCSVHECHVRLSLQCVGKKKQRARVQQYKWRGVQVPIHTDLLSQNVKSSKWHNYLSFSDAETPRSSSGNDWSPLTCVGARGSCTARVSLLESVILVHYNMFSLMETVSHASI